MRDLTFITDVKQKVILAILADDVLGERLVLKGGNLLQFAYQISSRASSDVDVSLDGDLDPAILESRVQLRLTQAFSPKHRLIDFSFKQVPAQVSDDIKMFWGGYNCAFKLVPSDVDFDLDIDQLRRKAVPLHGISGSPSFEIDISKHEYCGEKEEFPLGGYTIYGYSPQMFVAEKLRAICQQMPQYSHIIHRNRAAALRSRDFVDIHIICSHYGSPFGKAPFQATVQKVFSSKRVPLALIGKIQDTKDYHEPDFESVRATVTTDFHLEDFPFYFGFVVSECRKLEPLWNV